MSHFTVLVIGENPEGQLEPYHEFECTGQDDYYVKDIDITEQVRKDYEDATVVRYRDGDGNLYEPYSDEFYRDPTEAEREIIGPIAGSGCGGGIQWSSRDWKDGRGYRTKVKFKPDHLEEVEIPLKEIESFLEYCTEHEGKPRITEAGLGFERRENKGKLSKAYKYGYTVIDPVTREVIRVIRRTNPNAKWDWYQLGGRWTGLFKLKPLNLLAYNEVFDSFQGFTASEMEAFVKMKIENPAKFEKVISKYNGKSAELRAKVEQLVIEKNRRLFPEYKIGNPGLMTEPAKEGYADMAKKRDIDFEGMRDEAVKEAKERYDYAMEILHELPINYTWEQIRERIKDTDEARNAYWSQPRCKAWREKEFDTRESWPFSYRASPDDFLITEQEYIQKAANRAISTHAVIKDGKWYERGKMGWWAFVSNEKADWDKEFAALLDSVDDDTLLSVWDCHI
jgi:hypothetical protein